MKTEYSVIYRLHELVGELGHMAEYDDALEEIYMRLADVLDQAVELGLITYDV